jgi:hypothetical protein
LEDIASAFDFTRDGFAKEYRMLSFELILETSTSGPIRTNKANKASLSTISIPARE